MKLQLRLIHGESFHDKFKVIGVLQPCLGLGFCILESFYLLMLNACKEPFMVVSLSGKWI